MGCNGNHPINGQKKYMACQWGCNPTRVSMEVIVTSDRKLVYFTYLGDLQYPTYIGVKYSIDPKYQQDISAKKIIKKTNKL